MCCGKGLKGKLLKMDIVDQPTYPAIYYEETQVGAAPVVSMVFGKDGRRILYGQLANGESVEAYAQDIISFPNRYLSPCGKPYRVVGSTIENPCQETIAAPKGIKRTEQKTGSEASSDAKESNAKASVGTAATPAPVELSSFQDDLGGIFGEDKAKDILNKMIKAKIVSVDDLAKAENIKVQRMLGPKNYGIYKKWLNSLEEPV